MTFEKGKSGNPLGRCNDVYKLSEYARKLCPEILDNLAKIVRDPSEKVEGRCKAAKMVLDRGMGALIDSSKINILPGETIDVQALPNSRIEIEKFIKTHLDK